MKNNYQFFEYDFNKYAVFNTECMALLLYKGNKNDFSSIKADELCKKKVEQKIFEFDESLIKDKLLFLTICETENCNLACEYCYANAGSYNKIEKKIIPFNELKFLYQQLLKIYPKGIVRITFFGGEPMIGFDHIKKFIKFVIKDCEIKKISKPHFGIITNGTLINDEAWDFFNDYNVVVVVSLDGDKKINDEMRRFSNSNSSVFELVKSNLSNKKERNFSLFSEATLSKKFFIDYYYKRITIDYYYQTFYDLGFDSVSPFVAETSDMDLNDEAYINGVKNFFKDTVSYTFKLLKDDKLYSRAVPYVVSLISSIISMRPKRTCRAGKESLFYTSSGDIFPCQMYYCNEYKKLGNINDLNNLKSAIENKYVVSKNEIEECKNCVVKKICNFWCPGAAYLFVGSENVVDPIRCIVQKSIFSQVVCELAKIFERDSKGFFINNIKKLSQNYSAQKYLKDIV